MGSHGEWSFSDSESTSTEYVFVRDASKVVGGKKSKAAVGTAAKAKAEAKPKPAKQKAAAAAAEPKPAKQPRRASARVTRGASDA